MVAKMSASNGEVLSLSHLNNRKAVAWYDATAIYVPVQWLRDASGETLKAQQIVKAPVNRDLLAKRHNAHRTTVRHVPEVGRVDAYALKRQEFGRRFAWQGSQQCCPHPDQTRSVAWRKRSTGCAGSRAPGRQDRLDAGLGRGGKPSAGRLACSAPPPTSAGSTRFASSPGG